MSENTEVTIKKFKKVTAFLEFDKTTVDSFVLVLHCGFTTVLLLMFSMVVTCTQQFGVPIQCLVPDNLKEFEKAITTFCWVSSTYTMPLNGSQSTLSIYPGVYNDFGVEEGRTYYNYYQWVCFALFFQALLSYIPQYLWTTWEGGLMKSITQGLHSRMYAADEISKKKKILLQYLGKNFKVSYMAFRSK